MVGCDIWSGAYKTVFTKERCEDNARAEGVSNVRFEEGNAVKLPFPDESFDAVTSNYVYHNITGQDKQKLLLETLRVLKKGGVFAIHDLMSRQRYGDMDELIKKLKAEGYEEARLIDTTTGMFMGHKEAAWLGLSGSTPACREKIRSKRDRQREPPFYRRHARLFFKSCSSRKPFHISQSHLPPLSRWVSLFRSGRQGVRPPIVSAFWYDPLLHAYDPHRSIRSGRHQQPGGK